MIASFRFGMGSLVDQWFGRMRARKAARPDEDRQGSRVLPRGAGAEGSPWLGVHSTVAMRRFMAHALDAKLPQGQRLRADEATEPNAREANQAAAAPGPDGRPAVQDGLYLVPKVIE